MKIEEICTIGEYNDVISIEIEINGECCFALNEQNECPEDAIFSRDLSDCFNIIGMLEKAYEAGKNGEELFVERKDISS